MAGRRITPKYGINSDELIAGIKEVANTYDTGSSEIVDTLDPDTCILSPAFGVFKSAIDRVMSREYRANRLAIAMDTAEEKGQAAPGSREELVGLRTEALAFGIYAQVVIANSRIDCDRCLRSALSPDDPNACGRYDYDVPAESLARER